MSILFLKRYIECRTGLTYLIHPQSRRASLSSMATKMATNAPGDDGKEKYTFFWRVPSPFSQFYGAEFTVNGIVYNCAEQYMMHQKAVLFGDEEIADEIMVTSDPKVIKSLGRKVRNFDPEVWDEKCRGVVKDGNMAKFSQNPELKKKLFETAGTVLVEASPMDKIWGIGLTADKPEARQKRTWRGKNWLGYVLTQVRDELMAAEKSS